MDKNRQNHERATELFTAELENKNDALTLQKKQLKTKTNILETILDRNRKIKLTSIIFRKWREYFNYKRHMTKVIIYL